MMYERIVDIVVICQGFQFIITFLITVFMI